MLLDISIEPPGVEAKDVLRKWLALSALQKDTKGQVEISGARCLEELLTLRSHCYDRDLTVNVKFINKEE